jgi:UDP-perosamine 4-acetyltransferase
LVNNLVCDDRIDNCEKDLLKDNLPVLFCVGYNNMKMRGFRYNSLKKIGIKFISFFSENSILSSLSKIHNGVIINQGAIIDNYVTIKENVFINIGAMISHDTVIGSNVFIAPGVNIAGNVNIGENSFIGINSTVINDVKIGSNSLIAAGSVVIENVPDNTLVAGNPAKIKKILD